jgi:hypothetical protein
MLPQLDPLPDAITVESLIYTARHETHSYQYPHLLVETDGEGEGETG